MSTRPQRPTIGEGRHRVRRGEGDLLREQILDAGARLLADLGDEHQVSMRAVADAVGVTPPSLYLHFSSKTSLLRAVVERLFAELEQEVATARAGAEHPVARVLAFAHAYVELGLRHPGRYRVLYETGLVPSLMPATDVVPGRELLDDVAGDLEAARADGVLGDLDPWATAARVWQFLHGAVSLRINKPGLPWGDPGADVDAGVRALLGAGG
ncbi:TetR/AcrR family transcriptional regulator [Kineococcus gynurae]|uniref:TetR/AcrR family transcriptional regulator n=1 Tax=Kineococcus gynurae TaxID=452979 RepID=A0ABV5LXK4_9ACTN